MHRSVTLCMRQVEKLDTAVSGMQERLESIPEEASKCVAENNEIKQLKGEIRAMKDISNCFKDVIIKNQSEATKCMGRISGLPRSFTEESIKGNEELMKIIGNVG